MCAICLNIIRSHLGLNSDWVAPGCRQLRCQSRRGEGADAAHHHLYKQVRRDEHLLGPTPGSRAAEGHHGDTASMPDEKANQQNEPLFLVSNKKLTRTNKKLRGRQTHQARARAVVMKY